MLRGCVHGSILYLIFVKQLFCNIPGNAVVHSDGVIIRVTEIAVMQLAMKRANCWSIHWSLPINDDKCACLPFDIAPFHQFRTLGNLPIQIVDHHKVSPFQVKRALSFLQHQQLPSKWDFRVFTVVGCNYPFITVDFRDFTAFILAFRLKSAAKLYVWADETLLYIAAYAKLSLKTISPPSLFPTANRILHPHKTGRVTMDSCSSFTRFSQML